MRMFDKPFTLLTLCAWGLRFFALFGVLVLAWAAWAQVVQLAPDKLPGCREARKSPLFWIILAVSLGIHWDPGRWIQERKHRLLPLEQRANAVAKAVQEIWKQLKPKSTRPSFSNPQEKLLIAAETELRQALGIPHTDHLRTNLCLHIDETTFRVVQRSSVVGNVPKDRNHGEEMAVTQSMRGNSTIILRNHETHKRYTIIGAVPIAANGKAYGAITVDCQHRTAIKGKERTLDLVLRPYAAMLLLTLGENPASTTCKED